MARLRHRLMSQAPTAPRLRSKPRMGCEVVRLERVTEQVELDTESLTYLGEHGFTPGTDALVRTRGPDGTLILELAEGTIALGPALAEQLFTSAPA